MQAQSTVARQRTSPFALTQLRLILLINFTDGGTSGYLNGAGGGGGEGASPVMTKKATRFKPDVRAGQRTGRNTRRTDCTCSC